MAESATTRAGTVTAIITVGGIALLAVAVVVLWARLSARSTSEAAGAAVDPVPSTLVAGIAPADVPANVASVFDAPVIGAANLDELPAGVEQQCSQSFGEVDWDEGSPTIEFALATTDAIHTSLLGNGQNVGIDMGGGPGAPDRFRLTCTARHEDGQWIAEGSGFEPIFDEDDGGGRDMGGGGLFCCDDQGLATATGSVQVPADAAWGLQDRNGWFLAYPVGDRKVLTVAWKIHERALGQQGGPQTIITFVDDEGGIIEEASTGGDF